MKSLLILLVATYVSARAVEEMRVDDDVAGKEVDLFGDGSDTDLQGGLDNPSEVGHWYGTSKVAFSAYLSSNKVLGQGQHLKFDQVLLNDGDSYEASTGVFRAKVSGVYLFTYTVAQRNHNEIRVKLVSDGKTINGAVAEGRHRFHDVQGTNTAIIHVCKDKPVWVESVNGAQIEGNSANFRFTTFSGYLLYARR